VASSPSVESVQVSELAVRLESTFRLLGKRIYLPSLRRLTVMSRGLDRASVPLLGVLEEHGAARPSDLAAALELDPSTVSRQLRHLESLGLVSRSADRVDGRAILIGLTAAGRDSLATVRDARAAALQTVLANWDGHDRELLLTLLDQLLDSLANVSTYPFETGQEHS
jgi:DNA-binding MarR family transcriptional regulator